MPDGSGQLDMKSFETLSAREHADLANRHALQSLTAADGGGRDRALAVAHIEAAIEALAEQDNDDPLCRAMIHNSFAVLVGGEEQGDSSDMAELALYNSQQALALLLRAGQRHAAAGARANVGTAYLERRAGSEAANIEQAIHHLEKALPDLPEGSPEWIDAKGNLASAYQRRRIGAPADNMTRAIRCIRDTFPHVSPIADPERWADLHNSLGIALMTRPRGEGDLREAITQFQEALAATKRDRFPRQWADLHSNLSLALEKLAEGDMTHLPESIEHLRLTLEFYTLHAYPRSHLETQRALGHKLLQIGRFAEAHTAFAAAIDAERILFANAFTWQGRQEELRSSTSLFSRDAYCLARLGRVDESLARLEQGRSRVLNETLFVLEARSLADSDGARITKAQERVRRLEAEHRTLASQAPSIATSHISLELAKAREALVKTVEALRPNGLGNDALPAQKLLAMIPATSVLVAPIVTEAGTEVLIVPGGTTALREEHVLHLDAFTLRDLHELLGGDHGWLSAYDGREEDPDRWRQTITSTCRRLWDTVIGPTEAHARGLGLAPAGDIVLLPPGLLGVLPLHAAMRTVGQTQRCLADDFVVSYAPSIEALASSIRITQRESKTPASAFVVASPSKALPFAALEAEFVLAHFQPESRRRLAGARVTPKRIIDAAPHFKYLHFSCHGRRNVSRPLLSSLQFARGALTLGDILARLDLAHTRLAVLSACETSLFEIRSAADEELGLTSGFLQAGAACVVSSLWPVEDVATMLLMQRFYQLHLATESSKPADALRAAQQWLKTATNKELAALLREFRATASGEQQDGLSEQLARFAFAHDPLETPFGHPYYWAAFVIHGA